MKDSEEGSQTTNIQTHRLATDSLQTHRLATYSPQTRHRLTQTTMSGIELSVHFTMKDLMTYPEMRKALQEREQQYLTNMRWLDQDLERLVEEDERKKKVYEENLAWLDRDLELKLEERHELNLAWLDQDLDNLIEQRRKDMLQEIELQQKATTGQLSGDEGSERRVPKIWHCGHTFKAERSPPSRSRDEHQKWFNSEIDVGKDQCVVLHNNTRTTKGNTHVQVNKFIEESRPGDIIFRHTQKKLTHYGYITGEVLTVSRRTIHPNESEGEMVTRIPVEKWIPLPEVLDGTRRNSTLYEVKPHNKNYQNYSIMS